jgi:hypothetical protein
MDSSHQILAASIVALPTLGGLLFGIYKYRQKRKRDMAIPVVAPVKQLASPPATSLASSSFLTDIADHLESERPAVRAEIQDRYIGIAGCWEGGVLADIFRRRDGTALIQVSFPRGRDSILIQCDCRELDKSLLLAAEGTPVIVKGKIGSVSIHVIDIDDAVVIADSRARTS